MFATTAASEISELEVALNSPEFLDSLNHTIDTTLNVIVSGGGLVLSAAVTQRLASIVRVARAIVRKWSERDHPFYIVRGKRGIGTMEVEVQSQRTPSGELRLHLDNIRAWDIRGAGITYGDGVLIGQDTKTSGVMAAAMRKLQTIARKHGADKDTSFQLTYYPENTRLHETFFRKRYERLTPIQRDFSGGSHHVEVIRVPLSRSITATTTVESTPMPFTSLWNSMQHHWRSPDHHLIPMSREFTTLLSKWLTTHTDPIHVQPSRFVESDFYRLNQPIQHMPLFSDTSVPAPFSLSTPFIIPSTNVTKKKGSDTNISTVSSSSSSSDLLVSRSRSFNKSVFMTDSSSSSSSSLTNLGNRNNQSLAFSAIPPLPPLYDSLSQLHPRSRDIISPSSLQLLNLPLEQKTRASHTQFLNPLRTPSRKIHTQARGSRAFVAGVLDARRFQQQQQHRDEKIRKDAAHALLLQARSSLPPSQIASVAIDSRHTIHERMFEAPQIMCGAVTCLITEKVGELTPSTSNCYWTSGGQLMSVWPNGAHIRVDGPIPTSVTSMLPPRPPPPPPPLNKWEHVTKKICWYINGRTYEYNEDS